MPEVTVLLTVYNGMPFLPEAVESILGQSYADFLFLIVNNGSVDGTKNYLNSLTDPRLRVQHLAENRGRTGVLNYALEQVETELVAIIDADDVAGTNRLREQYAFMKAHPEIVLLGSDVAYINGQGRTTGNEHFASRHEELRDNLPVYNQFAHAACMFRTSAARAAGGYPPDFPYAQDLGLWIAMMARGGRVASIQQCLAFIRVHAAQATKNPELLQARTTDNLHLAEKMLEIPGISRPAVQMARIRIAGAYFLLKRYAEAADALWQAMRTAPLLLPVNPLLWKRLRMTMRKRLAFFSRK